ncbi:hypothetical protein CAPTEDRAFT_204097 [Capitella teleta]|uniref:Uncharacterized protein n=1 Tax=Capitella teleta TaxID=283909 RepID=R7UMN9_CAPTE|nr:hypothetical protein CAPTEDRAFT_204097 [Capitella teleta]|eukprot:ELU07485.1 hypothetical protein CAPTEDRAFT_204097 [Capitella teleta]
MHTIKSRRQPAWTSPTSENPEALFDLLSSKTLVNNGRCHGFVPKSTLDWDVFSSVAEVFGLDPDISTGSDSSVPSKGTPIHTAKVLGVYSRDSKSANENEDKKSFTSALNKQSLTKDADMDSLGKSFQISTKRNSTTKSSLSKADANNSPKVPRKSLVNQRGGGPPSFRTAIARRNSKSLFPPPAPAPSLSPPPPPPDSGAKPRADDVLAAALRVGDVASVTKVLQEKTGDFWKEYKETNGNSMLHLAVEGGNLECVKLIYKWCPGLINAENRARVNPVSVAIQNGEADILEWFLANDKSLLDKSGNKRPLVHLAAKYGQDTCLRLLLDTMGHANVTSDSQGNTPAHVAAMQGHLSCLQSLVEYQISVTAENHKRQTPCFFADFNNHIQCVAYLMMVEVCLETTKNLLVEKQKGMEKCMNEDELSTEAANLMGENIKEAAQKLIVYRTRRKECTASKPDLPPRGFTPGKDPSSRARRIPDPPVEPDSTQPTRCSVEESTKCDKDDCYAVIDDVIKGRDIPPSPRENEYLTPVARPQPFSSVTNIPKRSSFQRLSFRRAVNKCKDSESDEFETDSIRKQWRKKSWPHTQHRKPVLISSNRNNSKPTPIKIRLSEVDFKETYCRPPISPEPVPVTRNDSQSEFILQKPRIVAIRTRSMSKEEAQDVLRRHSSETGCYPRMSSFAPQTATSTDPEKVSEV